MLVPKTDSLRVCDSRKWWQNIEWQHFDNMLKIVTDGQNDEDTEDKLLHAPVMTFTVNKKDIALQLAL